MRCNLPRTSFNSPRLVRLLAELTGEPATGPKQSFAERLGLWLDLNDAIALSGALAAAAPAPGTAAGASGAAGLREDFARVRAALAESIGADGVAGAGPARIRWPAPAAGATAETAADFTPYRRYYAAHQREMESAIGLLRSRARQALAACSPALARLAGLDAVLEKALGERERSLLAGVPQLLERRGRALCQAALAAGEPASWLPAFRRDLQAVLFAELEVRLLPVAGLVEAAAGQPPPRPAATADAGAPALPAVS